MQYQKSRPSVKVQLAHMKKQRERIAKLLAELESLPGALGAKWKVGMIAHYTNVLIGMDLELSRLLSLRNGRK